MAPFNVSVPLAHTGGVCIAGALAWEGTGAILFSYLSPPPRTLLVTQLLTALLQGKGKLKVAESINKIFTKGFLFNLVEA